MNRIYYIIYKTTNKLNNKIYVGKHQTDRIDDGYLGSGIALARAIKKYGEQYFEREILFMALTLDDLNWVERNIFVTSDVVKNKNYYNMVVGGPNAIHTDETLKKSRKTKLQRYGDENYTNRQQCEETCLRKYGVKYALQVRTVRDKITKTKVKKYGDNYMMDVFNKGRKTKTEKYNDPNYNNRQKYVETNLNRYGVNNYSQTSEGRKKIQQRQLGHTRTVGDKNPKARRIDIISPVGEIYSCFGNFSSTCKELGISESTLKKQYTNSKPITRGKTKGWSIKYPD